ncbi:MAG: hypothetical protein GW886_06065 [Rhodobacterales bacterium]|nr:hypothetical protein [Rhodobacterales bacterium]
MQTTLILLGSMLGFVAAVIGLFVFGLGLWSALVIWAASGPLSALVALLASLLPWQPSRRTVPVAETA